MFLVERKHTSGVCVFFCNICLLFICEYNVLSAHKVCKGTRSNQYKWIDIHLTFQESYVTNAEFLKYVNFIDQTVCRPGIHLDFEVFSINSHKAISTRSNNLKLGTITPKWLINNFKKKVKKYIFFCWCQQKMCKSLPKICTFLELELKNLQIFCH